MADENIRSTRALGGIVPAGKRLVYGRRGPGFQTDAARVARFFRSAGVLKRSFAVLAGCGLLASLPNSTYAEDSGGIIIGGQPSSKPADKHCLDIEIGGSHSFDCFNQELRRQVDQVAPSLNTPPLDAKSPDTQIGIVNIPAVQEQYGKNFGKSVIPYRPPTPSFTQSLAPR